METYNKNNEKLIFDSKNFALKMLNNIKINKTPEHIKQIGIKTP